MIKTLIILIIFINSSFFIFAQSSSILSGYIKDADNKETLVGATINLNGTKYGAYTNKDGYYVIKNIPAGKYKIIVSSIGYQKFEQELEILSSKNERVDFELKTSDLLQEEILVTSDKYDEKAQINISKVNIPIQQIREIRIGGESDIFRSLQLLPGVLTSSQISSGLYIRGGSPDQNLVLLDGATVYNPSHLFGFISAFNTEAVKDVDLIKGGFNSEYGGRLSSVLSLTQKDGDRENFGGIFNVGVISSKLALEGPLGNGSWFVGGRRTYLELVKSAIGESVDAPLPDFNFYDLNAKISQDFGENDKIFITGFMSSDFLQFGDSGVEFDIGISNELLSARWTHIFSPDLFSTLNLSSSKYTNGFNGDNTGYKVKVENAISDFTIKNNFEWFNSDVLNTKFGYEINFFEFDYLTNFTGDLDSTDEGSAAGRLNLNFKDVNIATYIQSKYDITDLWSIQGGLRLTYFDLADQLKFDPRLSLRYQLGINSAIKASWGIYHQNLKLATLPDFSFFDTWLGTDNTLNIAQSIHYILSYETEVSDGYDFNFDVYYKTLDNITEIKQNNLTIENGADVVFEGIGRAYGFEVFLQKKVGDFTGWIGYALGFIEARFDSLNFGEWFRPKYDRRHDFKIVAQYDISESFNLGANFTFQSGQSYTGMSSRFQWILPGQNIGRNQTFPTQRYGLRLPNTHQLNINASYKFTIYDNPARIILDVFNVYNRRDIWFRFYDTNQELAEVQDIRLLPILPTLSFEYRF